MTKLGSYIKYIFKARKLALFFVLIVCGYVLWDFQSGWVFSDPHKIKWDDDFNHVVSIATLFVAISVWFAELSQEWRNQLPKRLTVNFSYQHDNTSEPVIIMKCNKAHLSDVADIRSLGQQIGMQLVDPDSPKPLSFRAPFVKQEKGKIEHSPEVGYFRHYTVTFTLTKLPDQLKNIKYKSWEHPFDKKDIKSTPIQ